MERGNRSRRWSGPESRAAGSPSATADALFQPIELVEHVARGEHSTPFAA